MIQRISIILLVLIFTGCEETPLDFDETCATNPSFADCVQPVFDYSCTSSCHTSTTENSSGGLNLMSASISYMELYNINAEGSNTSYKRVEPLEPYNSLLYLLLTDAVTGSSLQMPPDGPIPLEQIEYIRKWIEQGALNN